MALPATAVIEIRSTATAGNLNGGGFNAARGGTDYTLQDAAQLTNTDGTSNASTNFASAGSTFTSVMVGNYLHLTAGTNATVGWYEIVAFVDANNVTLDRVCSTGAMTNGTFYVGGAISLGGTTDDSFFEIGVGGNIFYVKGAVTYTLNGTITITAAGGAQAPIHVIGYNTTRGDDPTGINRPTFACGASIFTSGARWCFYNLIFTGTGTTVFQKGSQGLDVNCKITNLSSTVDRVASKVTGYSHGMSTEYLSYWGTGVTYATGTIDAVLSACYIHDSKKGTLLGNQFIVLNNCIVADNVVVAVGSDVAGAKLWRLINCTLYGAENKLGVGFDLITTTTNAHLVNCIVAGFVSGVVHADAAQSIGYDDYNDFFNNTTDVTNWTKGSHDVAINPGFTNVTQLTGTLGEFAVGGSKLIDTTKNFTTLGVAAGEIVYIISGTGVTAGKYLIDSISTTTNPNDTLNITIPASPGTNTTNNKVYQITLGHDFSITGAI
jgi:hypothetical protein